MANPSSSASTTRPRAHVKDPGLSLEHHLRLIIHRKWLILGVFVAVSAGTFLYSHLLPNLYTSETVVLVNPQKVPDAYVKSTVTGDVRNRLSTLSNQILSATRLQKIIDTLNLYPEARKKMAREDIISAMRSDIAVQVVSNFGASQDLQAFRIAYSGKDPRLVAQVTNDLANLFIDENLKAREEQATGTTEFLQNQLQETRKDLEEQEAKLKDYKLKHLGEMPEQQSADLQILGQLQSQLQLNGDAMSRDVQQRAVFQSMLAQPASVVDLDDGQPRIPQAPEVKASDAKVSESSKQAPVNTVLSNDKAALADLLSRYTLDHPSVRKLQKKIEQEEKEAALAAAAAAAAAAAQPTVVAVEKTPDPPQPAPLLRAAQPVSHANPVLQSQINSLDAVIAKDKEESERLSKAVSVYQAKLSAIPVREQEITQLVRDYEISKAHYSQLLGQNLSAETATQLEIRRKGENFEILDRGQVAERPSSPNRTFINATGSVLGLILGLLLAVGTEVLGISITSPEDVTAAVGIPVLEVIPLILTREDRRIRIRRMLVASATAVVTVVTVCTILYYRSQI